jgi:hypothetical protein
MVPFIEVRLKNNELSLETLLLSPFALLKTGIFYYVMCTGGQYGKENLLRQMLNSCQKKEKT